MSKINILNEKQLQHYFDALYPELLAKFNSKKDELRKQAEEEKDNFAEHAEVIKVKDAFDKRISTAIKLIEISKLLKEVNKEFSIRGNWNEVTTEEGLELLKEEKLHAIEDTKLNLSNANLFVDQGWRRRDLLCNELRARLATTSVKSFEDIKNAIMESIDINSFFSTLINE